MSIENLNDILERLQTDDESVLKELFDLYYIIVCKAMYRFIKDKSTVEDLAQNVFIRFWEKRHQINITSSVKAYLSRMAINEAIGYLRKNKKWNIEEVTPNTPTSTASSVEEQYLQTELESKITRAINELPPKCRAIFQMSRFDDLTYREIAEKLGISIKTVENQMGKALRVLRKKMKGYLHIFF